MTMTSSRSSLSRVLGSQSDSPYSSRGPPTRKSSLSGTWNTLPDGWHSTVTEARKHESLHSTRYNWSITTVIGPTGWSSLRQPGPTFSLTSASVDEKVVGVGPNCLPVSNPTRRLGGQGETSCMGDFFGGDGGGGENTPFGSQSTTIL